MYVSWNGLFEDNYGWLSHFPSGSVLSAELEAKSSAPTAIIPKIVNKMVPAASQPGARQYMGWCRPSAARLGIKGGVVCVTVYGGMHLKDPLGLFEKSRGVAPVPGFTLLSKGLVPRIGA